MSTKKKIRRRGRLTLELILMTLLSLAAALAMGFFLQEAAYRYLRNKAGKEGYYEQQIEEALISLETFIYEKHVTADNIELLSVWAQQEQDVYVTFYRDVDDFDNPYLLEDDIDTEIYQTQYFDLELVDGTPFKAEMFSYISSEYFYLIDLIGYAAAVVIFVLILLLLIHKKIQYINCLEQELKILGSGNLEYPMTIRGNDELTTLAEGIEHLRDGILNEQLQKSEAEKANAELVTAMSHDLRTPLTSLIGYLELLHMHRYTDEEQLENYLEHCRNKAFQLKKMSDRLFEYFLVYGKKEHPYQFRSISCENLVEEFCNGQFFDWMDLGGTMECEIEELTGTVRIDSEYLQRVLDNVVSNLKKYGDINKPLRVHAFERQDMLHILLTNYVREQINRIESTQIGLRTCRQILEAHGGTFAWHGDGETFTMDGRLPLYHESDE